ncbi:MAG: protein kinase [Kofleriaceae bacterium]|nr:protein kinase [Kofleriaceae bacterium]
MAGDTETGTGTDVLSEHGAAESPVQLVTTGPIRPSAPPPLARGDLIGRTLGGYVVVDRLGRGGSADVYRAEDPSLRRSAVIKVMRTDLKATPKRIDRFLREARLASRLDHPYAAHIYAFGAEQDGLLWIAMEYVRGTTLDELMARRGPIPPAVFAPVFERLCEVVYSAHELGIVHRDIKLSNVMVVERAGQLLPKLLDFGIAKIALTGDYDPSSGDPPSDAAEVSVTGHGALIGSPPYMAPEQWTDAATVDHRADIYALGVVAYRCLAGRPPLTGATRQALAHAHLYETPPPLGVGSDELGVAVARALAKEPAARWDRAIDLGTAVRRAIGGAGGESVPLVDDGLRDGWEHGAPQPLAEAVAKVAVAMTTVEADAALRALVELACRWVATIALAGARGAASAALREKTTSLWGRDDATAWLDLAGAACAATPALPELPDVLAELAGLRALAARGNRGRTAAELTADVGGLPAALAPLERVFGYRLVVGGEQGAEVWMGVRQPTRPRALLWDEAVAVGEVVLLDEVGRIALRLTPLVRAQRPMPHAELELFLLWKAGKGAARLAAAPWGYERDDEEAGLLLAALGTTDTDTLYDSLDEKSPFPGLVAYGVADASRFFGREREVDALANRLVRSPMVAVVGSSGVGKSSFVHAGVVGRLQDSHAVLTLRPGRHPMAALCDAIAAADGGQPCLEADATARLRAIGERSERGALVVIDQLEEVATLSADGAECERFARALAAAADGASAPVRVVGTLRDDFAGVLESIDGWRGQVEVFVLATPSAEALRRILIEPARRAAVAIEPAVVDDIVAQVVGRAAALPLLSFTAARLWATRDVRARVMTHKAYQELGGVAGALARYADEVYANLGRPQQEAARQLFARLVAADGTRVPVPRRELAQLERGAGVSAGGGVIDRLIEARLLVVREGEADDSLDEHAASADDLVEVVHECLAERWPRLLRWRSEDAADRALLTDVRQAARRWDEQGRGRELLWRGAMLADLRRAMARGVSLTDREQRFAAASVGAEVRARRVRRVVVTAAMLALAAVAAVMAYLSVQADRSRGRAAVAAGLAERRLTDNLQAQARREFAGGAMPAALAYAAAALERGADDLSLRLLSGLAATGWRHQRGAEFHTEMMQRCGNAGRSLWADGTTLEVVDEQAAPVARLTLPRRPLAVDCNPAGDEVLVLDHELRRYRLTAPASPTVLMVNPEGLDQATDVMVAIDDLLVLERPTGLEVLGRDGARRHRIDLGRTFARVDYAPLVGLIGIGRSGKGYRLFDLRTGAEVADLEVAPIASAIARDGSRVVVGTRTGTIEVFDGRGRRERTIETGADVFNLWISDDGRRIVSAGEDAALVYAGTTGMRLSRLAGYRGTVGPVRFEPGGLWSGGDDGMVRHWGDDGSQLGAFYGPGGEVGQLVVTPHRLLVAGRTGQTAVYDRALDAIRLVETACLIDQLEYAAEAARAVAICDGDKVLVWDLAAGTTRIIGRSVDVDAAVAIDARGERVAVIQETSIEVWGFAGELVREIPTGQDAIAALALTDDAVWYSRTAPYLARIDLATGARTQIDHGQATGEVWTLSVLPGRRVFAHVSTGTLVELSPAGVVRTRPAPGEHGHLLTAVGGDVVAFLTHDRPIELWDARTLELRRAVPRRDEQLAGASLSPDGRLLAVVARAGVDLFDTRSGEFLLTLPAGENVVFRAGFAGDSRTLALDLSGRPATLAVPLDDRPAATIGADISCHVPLRLDGSKLVPSERPACADGAGPDAPAVTAPAAGR